MADELTRLVGSVLMRLLCDVAAVGERETVRQGGGFFLYGSGF